MILKKQVYQPDKKANPLIGILLFLISVVLFVITAPIGFVAGLLYSFLMKGVPGLGEYLLKAAISIDQLGNVVMQHLLNVLWIQPGGYKFGNRDETISSALGRNRKLKTLTAIGRTTDEFLDLIDPGHTLNSIDYYIEPTEEIIDTVAWIYLVDRKILCVKSPGNQFFEIPAGIRITGESDAEALYREMKGLFGIELTLRSLNFIGIFEAAAMDREPAILLRKTCYSALFEGSFLPDPPTLDIAWLSYNDRPDITETDQMLFDFLQENGDLD